MSLRISRAFALKQLAIIIVFLGIISILALSKYSELAANTQHSATIAISGALSASNARNYGVRKIHTSHGIAVSDCSDIATLQNGIPDGYSISASSVDNDKSVSCTLNGPNTTSSTFTATGIS